MGFVLDVDVFTQVSLAIITALLIFTALKSWCCSGKSGGCRSTCVTWLRRGPSLVILWLLRDRSLQEILFMALLWFVTSIPYSIIFHRKRLVPAGDGAVFTARDVYSDLTHSMFSVCTHFLLQSGFALALLRYATQVSEEQRDLKSRIVLEPVGLILQIYLLWRIMPHSGWKSVAQLRGTVAIEEHVVDDEDDMEIRTSVQNTDVPWGDVWVRLLMSAIVNGFIQRFLILAYPIFVRATPECAPFSSTRPFLLLQFRLLQQPRSDAFRQCVAVAGCSPGIGKGITGYAS